MSSYFEPIRVTPAWKMALVRMLGKRFLTKTPEGIVEYYVWRGRTYIVDVVTID